MLIAAAHVSTPDVLARLALAAVLAAAIGMERELNRQQAGLRTQLLLGVGAALFTVAGTRVTGSDPTRIAAQVVTGIGFIGGGAILRHGSSVRGITTAASIWVSAAVGVACGLGQFVAASVATAAALVALVGLKEVEHSLVPRLQAETIRVDLDRGMSFHTALSELRAVLADPEVVRIQVPDPAVHRIELRARLGAGADLIDLADRITAIDGVRGVEIRG